MNLVTLISPDNLNVNKQAIHLFGLEVACFLAGLFSLKLELPTTKDNHIKYSSYRNIIKELLGFEELTQLSCESTLEKIGILTYQDKSVPIIDLDLSMYFSLITETDVDELKQFKYNYNNIKKTSPKASKISNLIKTLKSLIICSDLSLRQALENWIDAIFENPKGGYLTKTAVTVFQQTLYNYAKGDINVALQIVQIATIQNYKLCDWAIEIYEKDQKNKAFSSSSYNNSTSFNNQTNSISYVTPRFRRPTSANSETSIKKETPSLSEKVF